MTPAPADQGARYLVCYVDGREDIGFPLRHLDETWNAASRLQALESLETLTDHYRSAVVTLRLVNEDELRPDERTAEWQ